MGNSSSHTHQPLERGFTRGTFGDVTNTKASSFRFSKRSPKKMDRLRRSFRDSFRRRKERVPESSKPHQWQSDEQSVRSATCSFPVKYLGCVEVFESRGMQICEEALKVLRNSRRRAVRGLLHVSGDGLRVVDDDTKGLIVDQTIEKVSFCAPDRNHERGFSYICRDGTTRRWMCHGFLAAKDSGERLSHAVGCAFAVCLERKQRRDKECGVTMTFDMKNSTFTRSGSFRQQTMTEKLMNSEAATTPSATVQPLPQSYSGPAIGEQKAANPFAIARPHAAPYMLERQGSFRGFQSIGASSPFKRQMSLRINDLPSNAERQKAFLDAAQTAPSKQRSVSPIPEISPQQTDMVNQLCQELSQGLSLLTDADDLNFNNVSSINQNTAAAMLGTSMQMSPNSPLNDLQALSSSGSNAVIPYNGSNGSNTSTVFSSVSTMYSTQPLANNSIPSMGSNNSYSVRTTTSSHGLPTAQVSPHTRVVTGITNSALATSPQKIIPVETVTPLPNAEQWLGQIVKSTSPAPRRATSMQMHGRTRSLSSAPDPFDAEWAADVAQTDTTGHSTNPFISPPKPPAQSFQVQL